MRILLASDAWHPQINGVVRTLSKIVDGLTADGHEVEMLTPEGRRTISLPGYAEIKIAYISGREIGERMAAFQPDSVHIATEGPIGWAVRKWCLRNKVKFTTSFHTRFAEYVSMRLPIPGIEKLVYRILRNFHAPAETVLAPTPSITNDLKLRGFNNVKTWTRGVDHELFRPLPKQKKAARNGAPTMVYVGRVAVEKGIEDFLNADVPGEKVIIGDGPARKQLERKYPTANFLGYQVGEDLVQEMNKGDIFVFPSRTDTFGLVILEAMACGLPVAAYPVPGPIDVVEDGFSGALDANIENAIRRASQLKSKDAIATAQKYTWKRTVDIFAASLA